MRILMTGGTGFIGKPLAEKLLLEGHDVVIVSRYAGLERDKWLAQPEVLIWDVENSDCPISLDGFDAVIHLAGASIAGGRWTQQRREEILRSRVASAERLGAALQQRKQPLPCFLSASAVGYYPQDGREFLTEDSPRGSGFLADVCAEWEAAVQRLPQIDRRLSLRLGVVIGPNGGFLKPIKKATQLGFGTVLGNGQQWLSWVHRDDVIEAFSAALSHRDYFGVLNITAPKPVQQKDFQKCLSELCGRPLWFKAPSALLRLVLGDMAVLLLGSQRVDSSKLQKLGHRFRFPELSLALQDALNEPSPSRRSAHPTLH